jgi:hypothetical protein
MSYKKYRDVSSKKNRRITLDIIKEKIDEICVVVGRILSS